MGRCVNRPFCDWVLLCWLGCYVMGPFVMGPLVMGPYVGVPHVHCTLVDYFIWNLG
jgi:hypothetical protein